MDIILKLETKTYCHGCRDYPATGLNATRREGIDENGPGSFVVNLFGAIFHQAIDGLFSWNQRKLLPATITMTDLTAI